MKHTSIAASKVLTTLTAGLDNPGDAKTFDAHNYTEKWNGGIMAVHVENIGNIPSTGSGNLYGIAHYYKQNGDMMRDPDMVFWAGKGMVGNNGTSRFVDTFYPVSFRQDGAFPINQESVVFEEGKLKGVRTRIQADHARFANIWMKNIKEQQGI